MKAPGDRPICPRCGEAAYAGLLCEPCEVASNAEAFRPYLDYALAQLCPTCQAAPGQDCDAPRKIDAEQPLHRLHVSRQDRAISHRSRDVRAAPWPEAREPGRCYSTIPPAAEPAQVAPEAAQVSDTADPGDPPRFWRALIGGR